MIGWLKTVAITSGGNSIFDKSIIDLKLIHGLSVTPDESDDEILKFRFSCNSVVYSDNSLTTQKLRSNEDDYQD